MTHAIISPVGDEPKLICNFKMKNENKKAGTSNWLYSVKMILKFKIYGGICGWDLILKARDLFSEKILLKWLAGLQFPGVISFGDRKMKLCLAIHIEIGPFPLIIQPAGLSPSLAHAQLRGGTQSPPQTPPQGRT